MAQNITRKRRTTVTAEILKIIRKSLIKELSIYKIAEEAEISYSCAQNLINYISSGISNEKILSVSKRRKKKSNNNLILNIKSILMVDPAATLLTLKEQLELRNIFVAKSTISRAIKSMGYSRKRLFIVPEERNNIELINKRQIYCRQVELIPDENLIFIDETGFNLHLSKKYGYSPINSKCYITAPANRNKSISLMLAIGKMGILGYELREGAFNGDHMINFITDKISQFLLLIQLIFDYGQLSI